MRALLATAGMLALTGAAAAAGAPHGHPQTLRRNAGGPVEAVAQDGRALAWLGGGGARCNTVHVLTPGGTETLPQPPSDSMTCRWDLEPAQTRLALAAASSSVLWTLHGDGSSPVDYVMTAQPGGSEQQVDRLSHASDGTGSWLGGVVGAGTTLAYSFLDVAYDHKLRCLSGGSCRRHIADGGIRIVADGQETPLPGSGPALQLAAAAGRIAYVSATMVGKTGTPRAGAGAPVEVVSAQDGSACATVPTAGVPLAIALTPHVLAILTRADGSKRVWWYGIEQDADGNCTTPLLGNASVSRRTAPQLAANDRTIVYRVGRTLRGISVLTGADRVLARAATAPLDLSLRRRRLAWAENRNGQGRIRTLGIRPEG